MVSLRRWSFFFLLCMRMPSASASASSRVSPRIHIYDLPVHLTEPRYHFGALRLTDRLRASVYFEPDASKADFFWIPHEMPFRSHNWTSEAYQLIRNNWPYLNASILVGQTRHFITLTGDHGPGSCGYADTQLFTLQSELPGWWNPANPSRVVGHIMLNGRRDGAGTGCFNCFQQSAFPAAGGGALTDPKTC